LSTSPSKLTNCDINHHPVKPHRLTADVNQQDGNENQTRDAPKSQAGSRPQDAANLH
jgi:hypothetical protein